MPCYNSVKATRLDVVISYSIINYFRRYERVFLFPNFKFVFTQLIKRHHFDKRLLKMRMYSTEDNSAITLNLEMIYFIIR